jgi:DNA-binding response OmpR family regulator
MENWILTVGCPKEEFVACQKEWLRYNMLLRLVKTMQEAVEEITKSNYLLFSICINPHEYLPYIQLIREIKPIPIMIVPREYSALDKLEAIQLGADSYLEMPNSLEECVASGWALVRRYTELNYKKQEHISIISNKDIFICLDYRKVFIRSIEVNLTRIEFDILQLLMSNKKRVFTYEQIFCHVWGNDYFDSTNSILWNHIKRLRQKLKTELDMPDYIKNVHDLGYVFDPE